MSKQRLLFLIAFATAFTTPTFAQEWTIEIKAGQIGVKPVLGDDGFDVTQAEATITVICAADEDCADLSLTLLDGGGAVLSDLSAATDEPKKKTFEIDRKNFKQAKQLRLRRGSTDLKLYPLKVGESGDVKAKTNKNTGRSSGESLVVEWLQTPCPGEYKAAPYDERRNEGEVVLTPTGDVISASIDDFDEDDHLIVRVVGDKRLLPMIAVRRTSAFRKRGVVRIVGAGTSVPLGLDREAEEAPECSERDFRLQDFEPGRGEVQIVVTGNPERTIGTFEFGVNPLYTGMFSLGGVWTRGVNPDYKLVARNGADLERILVKGNEGDYDFLYAVLYTHYIWGKRDIQKKIDRVDFLKRFNPTVGLVLNDLDSHALVGISLIMANGLILTGGIHLRRTQVLVDGSGAEVGAPFLADPNMGDGLPTAEKWKGRFFFSVSLDIRAAVSLITTATGAGSGG